MWTGAYHTGCSENVNHSKSLSLARAWTTSYRTPTHPPNRFLTSDWTPRHRPLMTCFSRLRPAGQRLSAPSLENGCPDLQATSLKAAMLARLRLLGSWRVSISSRRLRWIGSASIDLGLPKSVPRSTRPESPRFVVE